MNVGEASEREEVQVFHDHLKRCGMKRTVQRDLILDVFLRTEAHVSSEDLYELVKAEDASVGFTTVYRTLKLLAECGLARDVEFYDGRTLYEHDFKHGHHDHLICTSCGALIEFYSEVIENMQDQIVREHQFRPSSHSLRIFGTCRECQAAEAKRNQPVPIGGDRSPAVARRKDATSGHQRRSPHIE